MDLKKFIYLSIFILLTFIAILIYIAIDDPIDRQSINLDQEEYKLNDYIGSSSEKGPVIDTEESLENYSNITEHESEELINLFFGFLKNGEYYAAASLIEVNQYIKYFYVTSESGQDFEGKINHFGEVITKNESLKEVKIAKTFSTIDKDTYDIIITYEDNSKINYKFNTIKRLENHSNTKQWYIDINIEDFLNSFS